MSKPTRQRPADSLPQTQTESSIVMKKLSSLPAGFNDVSAPNNMPLYGNQSKQWNVDYTDTVILFSCRCATGSRSSEETSRMPTGCHGDGSPSTNE